MARRPSLTQEATVISHEMITQAHAFAVGTISCGTNAAAADGDIVSIGDGMNPVVVYEYDKSANGVTAGRVAWPVGTTAASLATALAALIAANQPGIAVVDDLAGNLTLTHRWHGSGGNVTTTKTGAAVTTVTGMAGGSLTTMPVNMVHQLNLVARDMRVEAAKMSIPPGFVADVNNFWTVALNVGGNVVASWSTKTTAGGGQGTISPNTPVQMVLSATDANLVIPAGSAPTVTITKTGTPNSFPVGRLDFHGHFVS